MKKDNKKRESAVISKQSEFSAKEAYKTLRTNILFSLKNDGEPKVVVITSAIPGDGKTTTALNIAVTFSQIGSRVLLIDGDLRKPKIHSYLNVENNEGLSGVLGGFVTSEKVIMKTQLGFDCITAGSVPPNPSELISSAAFIDMINNLKNKYDYIFIDSPPVSIVSDTLTISSISDGVLLIARSKYTPKSMLSQAIDSIKFTNSKIIGIVLNGVDETKRRYGVFKGKHYSKYGYGAYGRYGYYYYNTPDSSSNK